jgi:mono/diheme cytochrome c family protein
VDHRCRFAARLIVGGLALAVSGAFADKPAGAPTATLSPQHALINQYCVVCHNEKAKTAGLMLDKLDIDHAAEHAETWEKVVRKLRGGMMPPQGMPRPPQEKIDGLITWL